MNDLQSKSDEERAAIIREARYSICYELCRAANLLGIAAGISGLCGVTWKIPAVAIVSAATCMVAVLFITPKD